MRWLVVATGEPYWERLLAALAGSDCEGTTCHDVANALFALQRGHHDVVVMSDAALGQGDVVVGVRSAFPGTVLVLAHDGDEHAASERALEWSFDGAVCVPAETAGEVLLARFEHWLARRRDRLAAALRTRTKSVLLVTEPAAETGDLARRALETAGHAVICAQDKSEALHAFDDDIAQVAVIRAATEIDCARLVASLRRREPAPEIVVWARADELATALAAMGAGASELLMQPTSDPALVTAVQHALHRAAWRRPDDPAGLEAFLESIPCGVIWLRDDGAPPTLNFLARGILSPGPCALRADIERELGFHPRARCCGNEGPVSEPRRYRDQLFRVECRCVHGGAHLGTLVLLHDAAREQQLDDHKSEFSAIVSHELRTPLTAIKNALDLVRDEAHAPLATRERMIEIAYRNNERMMTLVEDLLDLSRLEAGRRSLALSETNPSAVAAMVLDAQEPRAAERGVKLTLEVAGPVESCYADALAIERVLLNLVSNAAKYTRENTDVTVRLDSEDDPVCATSDARSKVLRSFASSWLRFEVIDWGFGIPVSEQRRIFEKFVRIDRQAYGKSSGTGLGLTIAERLVRAHGGELWVKSSPGEGATFGFRIPVFDRHGALGVTLADHVQECRRGHWSLGIIVLRLLPANDRVLVIDEALGDRLTKAARDALYRGRDFAMFVPKSNELILLLEGCLPEAVPRARARVAAQVRDELEAALGPRSVLLAFGNTFSPPGGSVEDAIELLAAARDHARRPGRDGGLRVDNDATTWRPAEDPTSWTAPLTPVPEEPMSGEPSDSVPAGPPSSVGRPA